MTTEELRLWKAERGSSIYRYKIARAVEPEYDGEFIAIDVETREWAVRPTEKEAIEALGLPSDRHLYCRRVGPLPRLRNYIMDKDGNLVNLWKQLRSRTTFLD